MRRRAPLSPGQSAAFAMGRALILFDTWRGLVGTPLDAERGVLIDFAVQHPRSISSLVPTLAMVARAHGLHKHDVAEVFVQRRLPGARTAFFKTIANLAARGLISEEKVMHFALTDTGLQAAAAFCSPLSMSFRALSSVLCDEWKRKNVEDLGNDIRRTIPDQSGAMESMIAPFEPWLDEVD